ncbi:MAG: S4 domain-containing protein [Acidobacteriota bacterium]
MSTTSPSASQAIQVRLDKWLQVARVFKTRSQATRACQLNRVRVNDQPAKAHRNVVIGDRIEVEIDRDWTRVVVVKALADKPIRKDLARELFDDESPERPKLDPVQRLMRRTPVERAKGLGRPSKRDRRQLDRLRGGDES